MNHLSIYILLILIYLGVSKSFAPAEKNSPFIRNQHTFSSHIKDSPVSAILVDYFKAGFLIKTYFHKYKIVHGFKAPEILTVRTSKEYYKANIQNLGMSLFNRKEKLDEESFIPSPPGMIYVGDSFYGKWVNDDSGSQVWEFHRGYRHFPEYFGWGNFRPSKEFYAQFKINLSNDRPFYGLNQEFGLGGKVTSDFFSKHRLQDEEVEKVKNHLKKFMSIPWQRHPIWENRPNKPRDH